MRTHTALAVVWCCGSDQYFHAAAATARSILINTDLDVVLASPDPNRVPLVDVPRLTRLQVDGIDRGRAADAFVGKFEALAAVLHGFTHDVIVMIDADCVVSRPWTSSECASLIKDTDFALAEQTSTRGTSMSRPEFLAHYCAVSLPGVAPHAPKPTLEEFRYFNTGVVIGRRSAWQELVNFARELTHSDNLLEVEGRMVADQDIIQVWLNSIRRATVFELLPEEWNASDLWCDIDEQRARVIHNSNFCQGPSDEHMKAIAPLDGIEIVIVTHQSEECLSEAIKSAQDAKADLVTVVDNASLDGSAEVARRNGARVIELEKNAGFATAANIGLLHAVYSDVIVMNPDVTINDEVVIALRESLATTPGVLTAPLQQTWNRGVLGWQSPMTRLHLIYAVLENSGRASSTTMAILAWLDRIPRPKRSQWLLGSCLAASRADWDVLHGFNTDYFLYMEDVDLSERWVSSGRELALVGAGITHAMGTGSKIGTEERIQALNKARIHYAKSRYGKNTSGLLNWIAR